MNYSLHQNIFGTKSFRVPGEILKLTEAARTTTFAGSESEADQISPNETNSFMNGSDAAALSL